MYLPNFFRKADLTLFLVSMLLGFEKLISDELEELEILEVTPVSDSFVNLVLATDVTTPSFSYL